jgi:eukaryotic-like serine/threonine-protein kinase
MQPTGGPDLGIRVGDLVAAKYQVDRILGVGGMGVVVAARHLRLEELVAIKVLLPEALADADAVRRFEREARAAVKIKSEHVARILDVGTLDSGAPFIVMEYLEGEDLAERLARTGPFTVEDAVVLLLEACEAIAEAHALGIVHRDLKPANLFCVQGADGRSSIKVLDFGISKFTRAGGPNSGLGMTKTRAVMGSPYYMSPEQMESPRSVDARTDIWSLGIVLYQLLTAEVPFSGETLPQVCVNVATRPAPSFRRMRPDVPNGLEAIALRCLEKDPSKRFPTVAALATALARFGPRQAQASLDRITRTWQQAESRLEDDGADPLQARATDRPVTGPLPSWGATAKSLRPRTRSIIGWATGVLLVVALLFTFVSRQPPTSSQKTPAVLITPTSTELTPPRTEPKAISIESLPPEVPTPPMVGSGAAEPMAPTATPPNSVNAATPALPEVPPRAAVAATTPQAPRPVAAPARVAQETELNPYVAAPEIPKRASTASTCLLNLNAMPSATVVLDGKPLGFTPKMGVSVAPGEHRVYFRWQDGDKIEAFTCDRGETKTIAVRQYDQDQGDEPFIKNPYR